MEILQRHLREGGYEADIFSTKGTTLQRLLMIPRLRKAARRYDILHIHCCSNRGFLPAVLGVYCGRRTGKRIVLSYHGGDAASFFQKRTLLVKHVLLRTNANIVLSGFLAQIFEQYAIPYTIIPNIIDFDATQYRKRQPLSPKFICTRTHDPIYDIPCLLRAFQRVQKEIPNAALTLVGDGEDHNLLVHQATEMGLQNICFTGRVDNGIIYEYLDNADIFVSPSTVDNMPISIIEAMNAGLLVIASNVGGIPYMVEDGKTGALFKPGDDVTLAKLMMTAIQDEGISIIPQNAHKTIDKYTWGSVKELILKAYAIED